MTIPCFQAFFSSFFMFMHSKGCRVKSIKHRPLSYLHLKEESVVSQVDCEYDIIHAWHGCWFFCD